MSVSLFHPVIQDWFRSRFAGPTEPQVQGWPVIAAGDHTLIAAPTGSGKTLTAFLAVIDRLLREAIDGRLADETRVVYVSPLRALSNDMHRNLSAPLEEILAEADRQGIVIPPIRVGLRTGDTPAHRRASLVRRPPHLLVTTPESLYLMLTAAKSREVLRSVDTLIVDEIHALVRDKRGSHLSLTIERLEHLTERPLQRIGISATQKPIERTAAFLMGSQDLLEERRGPRAQASLFPQRECRIVNVGHQRDLDLAIETPASELSAVCSHEQWAEVNARLVELIQAHRSTLIFVNTRRLAERVTHQLTGLLGEEQVGSHHGSLASDIRLTTEQRLKSGQLKAVVATASLELGIDIGHVDLVVQLGSPRSIATFLQRIGRSGHALGLVPKGRLFALTRDELIECMALIRAVKSGRLDAVEIPEAPIDILAQQIVAEVAAEEWGTDNLFALVRRAYPYRRLERDTFDRTIHLLSEGITDTAGRSRTFLHRDAVHGRVRARQSARLAALNNAGAIPEVDSIRVVLESEQTVVGSVDEDFGVESMAGDIFLLGNTSWRIQALRGNDLLVSDAHGAPPTIPFWRGEAPGRTVELSEEVSLLRTEIASRVVAAQEQAAIGTWLAEETHCALEVVQEAVDYVTAQQAAIGVVPSQAEVVFERFFDESGGMQLVVHAPFGGRINRAWGLAMRKRFCRSFDFELQASADDDGFVLSLGPQHSFPIESLFPMLTSENVRNLLEQALLAVPMFHLRWRWNVTRSLLVARMRNGRKVPPALQRFRSEDLLTAVFPKLTGCQEEHTGDHEIPDHPLVQQTVHDCLTEALDLDGLLDVLRRIERGEIRFVARDTREPSPFAYELLNANPYAFLDGGEIQERRARAVATRRSLNVESMQDLGRLDPLAIEQVVTEARPLVRNADELHDVLLGRILLPFDSQCSPGGVSTAVDSDLPAWGGFYSELEATRRATTCTLPEGLRVWVAAERVPAVLAAFPEAVCTPSLGVPQGVRTDWTSAEARTAIVRGLMESAGPMTSAQVAELIGITHSQADAALEGLEGEGAVLRGRFTAAQVADSSVDPTPHGEWCHRRLLARIHRLTVAGLRREIEAVDVATFVRFLFRHHGMQGSSPATGPGRLFEVIAQLQGLDMPAMSWERDLLPRRINGYRHAWLDELCLTGEVGWGRLYPPARDPDKSRPMASMTRVVPVSLFLREDLEWLARHATSPERSGLSSPAADLLHSLEGRGAMFASDIIQESRLLPAQLDDVLGELVARGFVTADAFSGLRNLIRTDGHESERKRRRDVPRVVRNRRSTSGSGRWSLWRPNCSIEETGPEGQRKTVEEWAWQLLRRWGVIFRDLLDKEPGAPRWWELVQVYRRLEARGEVRGGRFIRGVGGEQFAVGGTIHELRRLRDECPSGEIVVISATDPLNLIGVLTSHARVPSRPSNLVAYFNGTPVAHAISGSVTLYDECPRDVQSELAARMGRDGVGPSNFVADEVDSRESTQTDDVPRRRREARYPSAIPRPMIS